MASEGVLCTCYQIGSTVLCGSIAIHRGPGNPRSRALLCSSSSALSANVPAMSGHST